jgi:cathepsin L
MYKTALVLAAATAAVAVNVKPREMYEKLFFEHMQKYNLHFTNGEEFAKRLQVFADKVDEIETHNAGTATYKLALNKFSHLTFQEFTEAVHLGGTSFPNLRKNKSAKVHAAPSDVSALPASVDWVSAGAVTPVKNQGSCGSCWSFSTTGALEGAYFIKYGTLQSFSEQELVSCDTTDAGCNGGWMDDAFAWVMSNKGLAYEADYPYVSGSGTAPACAQSGKYQDPKVTPVGYTDVTAGSVTALQSALAIQPVSIAIQANQMAFQSYSSGVLTGRCGQRLDHGVLAVGYGTWTDGTPYWKVKNSWGPDWGMDRYILIERSDADLCGVLDAASYPNL